MVDLKAEVVKELRLRTPKEWKEIADSLDGVSPSMVAQLGRGKYKSSPTYGRLQKIYSYLQAHPRAAA